MTNKNIIYYPDVAEKRVSAANATATAIGQLDRLLFAYNVIFILWLVVVAAASTIDDWLERLIHCLA